jgi:hypothetical protein
MATEMGERSIEIRPGLVLFRLVVPSLQPGVVGPYLAQSERLPSHFAARGIQVVSRCFGS